MRWVACARSTNDEPVRASDSCRISDVKSPTTLLTSGWTGGRSNNVRTTEKCGVADHARSESV